MKKVLFRLLGSFAFLFITKFAFAIDVVDCSSGKCVKVQTSTRTSSVASNNCLAQLNGKNGCFKSSASGCLIDWSYCPQSKCSGNGGEWDSSNGTCVQRGTLSAKSGAEKRECDVDNNSCGNGMVCDLNQLKCVANVPQHANQVSGTCDNDKKCSSGEFCDFSGYTGGMQGAVGVCREKAAEVAEIKARGCNLKAPEDESCCKQANGQWLDTDDGYAKYCELGSRQVAGDLDQLRQKGLMCSQAAQKASDECNQETNEEAIKSKKEATSALEVLKQAGQTAGSSSLFIKVANMTAGVEMALNAMRISCEKEGETCTTACDDAKTGAEAILPKLSSPQDKRDGEAIIAEIKKGYDKCGKYKGALKSLLNDITKNAMARIQAQIAGNCASNSMAPDLQYCCQQPIPTSCYSKLSDPSTAAWNPGTTPTIAAPTSPACVANPAAAGCQIAQKATDVRSNVGGLGDSGRTGGGTADGSSGGSMPSFDFGSDGSHTSTGASGKPTDLAPPAAGGPGGYGGGGGAGPGGGGGGLGVGGGGGEHGGGSGDTLFDGTRVVGGGDPNRYGMGGTAGGTNSLSLSGGKTGAGVNSKIGPDGKLIAPPDFSQFDRNKSKLGIRGIAGATGPDGITGPDTNIWKKINNGYVNDIIYTPEGVKNK